jgi:hypothetical protein
LSVRGADPIWMLTAPIPATAHALAKTGLTIDDIDLVEINEAFASVVLAWLAETGCAPERVNVNGGAIALGHPLGATGARLMTTLLHELDRRGGRYALQTMCEGGGQANVTIIERVSLFTLRPVTQWKDRRRDPVAGARRSDCHEGNFGSVAVNGQTFPHGDFSRAEVRKRLDPSHCEVRYHILVLAAKRRALRECLENKFRQLTEWQGIARPDPEHLIAEPSNAIEAKPERAGLGEQAR